MIYEGHFSVKNFLKAYIYKVYVVPILESESYKELSNMETWSF